MKLAILLTCVLALAFLAGCTSEMSHVDKCKHNQGRVIFIESYHSGKTTHYKYQCQSYSGYVYEEWDGGDPEG